MLFHHGRIARIPDVYVEGIVWLVSAVVRPSSPIPTISGRLSLRLGFLVLVAVAGVDVSVMLIRVEVLGQNVFIPINLSLGYTHHSFLSQIGSIAYLRDHLHFVLNVGIGEGLHYLACHLIWRRARIVPLMVLFEGLSVGLLKHLH